MPVRNRATPGTTIARRQPTAALTPKVTIAVSSSGMTICVTPPPRFPQPAVVALAVPTMFGANMTEVWYCVITNEPPITPIASRNSRNVS